MSRIFQGQGAPDTYSLVVTTGDSGLDMSTVSVASLKVQKSDATTATWTASLSAQTATSVTITHSLGNSDLLIPGIYKIYASMTVPGGTARSDVDELTVMTPYTETEDW